MNDAGRTREYLSIEERRVRLLDAAADVVAASGSTALTLRSVAERANVAHRVVTYAFGSKDELVAALLQRESQRVMSAVWEPSLARQPLDEAVRRALSSFLTELARRPALHRGIAQLTTAMHTAATHEADAYLDAISARLEEWCALTGSTLTRPVTTVASAVLVTADGLESWWLTTQDDAHAADVIATVSGAFANLAVPSGR